MQSYPLQINAASPNTSIGVEADLFVYESGTVAAKTNLIKYSQQIDNAAWNKVNASAVVDGSTAPDATATADKLMEDGSNSSHYANQSVTGLADMQHTASIYVKAAGRTRVKMFLADGSSLGAFFDLATATVISQDVNVTATITADAAAGWFRLTVSRLITGGTATVSIFNASGASISYAGDGASGVYLWGAQLEQGMVASPYIATVAASASAAIGGSTAIRIKPENGAEIVLKPGQRFRIVEKARRWFVSANDGVSAITGTIIIGSGEFDDANTLNTFKLDATFANNVKVMNDTTARVPVTLDTAQSIGISNTTANRVPVTLDPAQTLNIAGNIVAYNTAYTSTAASVAGTAIQMLAAAANVNGAILNKFEVITGAGVAGVMVVIAKATAPANIADGDVLFSTYMPTGANKTSLSAASDGQIKVPAGKGIWYMTVTADGAFLRDALFTLL